MASCDKSFCTDYMLLSPEDVGLIDLIRILFSKHLEHRKFVDCPEGTEGNFMRRWLIFVSILAQKGLLSVSKPLACFGDTIEYWLNLLSYNRGLARLVWNFLRGKTKWPKKTDATFLSFIGYNDERVELDKKITRRDGRYCAALSVMAAKVSYENKAYIESVVVDRWKMDFLGFYDYWNDYQEKTTTQVFMMIDKTVEPELIVVAFRGTEPFDADAWSSDVDLSWYELHNVGKVHGGFMKALGLQKNLGWPKQIQREADQQDVAYYAIRDMLKKLLEENGNRKFIITGHSLGGALAILLPAIMVLHDEKLLLERLEGVFTFGQPRVGDEKFGNYMKNAFNKYGIRYYRTVYGYDIVPRLPYDDTTLMFKHFGTCVYYNSFYNGQIVEEEPDKNYFSIFSIIPKTINATWELLRSFVISFRNGPDYREGFVLLLMRVFGLVLIAGVPAHSTKDYVNSTRLGDLNVYNSIPNQSTLLEARKTK